MKKLLALLAVFGMLSFGVYAQDEVSDDEAVEETVASDEVTADEEVAEEAPAEEVAAAAPVATEEPAEVKEVGLHQQLKQKFIEGGAGFMGVVVLCLVLGLALAIERIIYLNLATTNTDKLLEKIEDALDTTGMEGALEVCRETRGPIASIFYQGLSRHEEGLEMVEKSVVSYGSVQMGLLEKGLTWISLFIALAPMLGFMGTVIGMIQAFDSIEAAGDISPTLVAGGIKVALITTVTGLVVAMILQVFYNYLLAKIDSLVNNMEDSSISLIDLLAKYNLTK